MKWLEKYKKTKIKVTLPYIQGLYERLRRWLKKIHIDVYFNNKHTLGKLLNNNKDSDKIKNLSNVVYLIKCTGYDEVYIVETARRLRNRIYEHKRDCRLENLNTGLSRHSWDYNHFFDFNNIKILARECNKYKRKIIESIYINKNINISINLKTEIMNIIQIYHSILQFALLHRIVRTILQCNFKLLKLSIFEALILMTISIRRLNLYVFSRFYNSCKYLFI